MGDEWYLPCEKAISCKAPAHVARLSYVLCKTVRYDAANRRLFLDAPTGYEQWSEKAYQISIQTNSALILALDVQVFEILWGSTRLPDLPTKPYWTEQNTISDWTPPFPKAEKDSDQRVAATPTPPSPAAFSINKTCDVAIEDLLFGDGKISFTRFVHFRTGEITFEIIYAGSRKEFDAVKGYFEKVLRRKTVKCQIAVEVIGRVIQSQSALFSDDDPFNKAVIEEVDDYILQANVFNNEEEIAVVEEKIKQLISLEEEERSLEGLLEKLGKIKKSKHYYHLRHLSSLHDPDLFRLRMTGRPASFIFVLRGEQDCHLVWETYETEEATYIWKLTTRDRVLLHQEMSDLLETIKSLRKSNKLAYIRSHPAGLTRLVHDYSQADGGLEKWKEALREAIM